MEVVFELKRKLIHLVGLAVPAIYGATSKEVTLLLVGAATVCAFIIEVARLKSQQANEFVLMLINGYARGHEERKVTGATYYAVAALLTVAFFSERTAIASLLFLTLGDSVAALVGTRYGVHKLFGKSVEGSCACFVTCSVVGWVILRGIGLVGAVAATFIELVPLPIDDNLRIPLVSGAVMTLLLSVTWV